MLSSTVKCLVCDDSFIVKGDNLLNKDIDIKGDKIYLKYCKCPKCGKIRFLQIDNNKSKDKLKNVAAKMVKMSKKRLDYEDISKKQFDKFKKDREYLTEIRKDLEKEYTGIKILLDGEYTELRFNQ